MSDELEFDPDAPTLDIGFYRDGGVRFSESELEVLGDVHGLDVLVSPEGSGDEALSLASLGAKVTIYGGMLESIGAASEELGWQVELVIGSLGEMTPDQLRGRSFALIYVPWGTVDGIEDLDAWASDASELLAAGGHVVMFDEHPVSFAVEERGGELAFTRSYWGEFIDEDADGLRDIPRMAGSTFGWAMGDLVTALGEHGMATLRLDEFEQSDRYVTALELVENVTDKQKALLPSAFLLVARKL